ncbi:glycosyltransferase family 2 protein [Phocaeicola sp.]
MVEISIVIATFNAAKTLKKCLDSIVPQLSNSVELIIIDGLSKDQTVDILKSYNSKITYYVSEPDEGIYDAWNKGIKVARGKWIAFIGADDVLLPNAIKTYLNAINVTPNINSYDYICAHNEYVDQYGALLKVMGKIPTWKRMRRMMVAAHVASLHNKENLFKSIGTYDLNFKICADYELLLRRRNELKYLMLDTHIAQMKVGGMSFSTKAIIEAYRIRKLHHSLPMCINELYFLRDWIAYKWFIIRKKYICGKKIDVL